MPPPDIQPPPQSLFARWMERLGPLLQRGESLLLLILLLAVLLRGVTSAYGLPLLLNEDEPIYLDHALGFGLGHWNLGYFKKPSFFLYLYAGVYYLAYLYTPFLSWKAFVAAFWTNPTYVALLGRWVTIAFAAGSVWLLARLGVKAFKRGLGVGLAAAFMLAVNTTHVRFSPIVISDIPSLFFILTAAGFALSISERGRMRDYVLCALMTALAISFKYNIFTVFFLIAAHFSRHELRRATTLAYWKSALSDRRLWLSLLLIPVVFLCLNPMILLDFPTFWQHINLERTHMLQRNVHSPEAFHLFGSFDDIFFKILPKALGWPLYILGLFAVPYLAWRHSRRAIVLLSFPLVFLLVVLQFQLINAKYLLPLYPFWFLAVAVLLQDFLSALSARGFLKLPAKAMPALLTVLVVAASYPVLFDSIRHASIHSRPDTRNMAEQAIRALAINGNRIFMEPDTLTLHNQNYRSGIYMVQAERKRFKPMFLPFASMSQADLNLIRPDYVLIDLGQADKQKDSSGKTFYRMPYSPAYYAYLQKHYRFNNLFTPYTIHLSHGQIDSILQAQGIGELYAAIQQNKTSRTHPGPALLLLQRVN